MPEEVTVTVNDPPDETPVVAPVLEELGETLEEHAELSEERHEEILEGELWTRNQLVQLSANILKILAVIEVIREVVTNLETRQTESTVTPSLPPEPEVIPVVQPETAVVVVREVPVTPTEEPARRKRRVI